MQKRNILHTSARVVFGGAAFGMAIAFIELAANLFGASIIDYQYSPGRILELAATLMTYVIAVLAWEILAELKAGGR